MTQPSHPFHNPADLAYRPPLPADATFPCTGPVSHPNLKELLYKSLTPSQVVADIGCGPGPFEYDKYPPQFIAFDAFEPDTKEGLKSSDRFVLGRLSEFPLDAESCDAVVMGYILEHVTDPQAFIAEADRVLKPGGYCYIAVPNHKSVEDRLFRLATKVAGSTRGPHIQRFTFESFQRDVAKCSSLRLLTWHLLDASFLWMLHPRLKWGRPVVLQIFKALRAAGIDKIRASNYQFIFQKPEKPPSGS